LGKGSDHGHREVRPNLIRPFRRKVIHKAVRVTDRR
jgi:hypothetical protein